MLQRILFTFISRIATAALSFLIVSITAQYLGAAGRGEITLIMLAITINLLASSLFGSGALVYLSPRYQLKQLLIITQIWAILSTALTTFILVISGMLASPYAVHVGILSFIAALYTNNQTLLQGYQRIKQFNLLNLIQLIVLVISFIGYIAFNPHPTVLGYILCLYSSYLANLIFSFYFIKDLESKAAEQDYQHIIQKFIYHGGFMILANIAQLLNYRFSFYVIESHEGLAQLGIFSVVVALSEGLWMITRSISAVQYGQVVNMRENQSENEKQNENENKSEKQKQNEDGLSLTMKYIRISLYATIAATLVLALIPDYLYTLIFGKEFTNLKTIILLFIPGIISLAVSNIIGHYFSGIGKQYLSTVSTAISLVATISLSLGLIPVYGIAGAAMAASASYFVACVFWLIIWQRAYPYQLSDFLIRKTDLNFIIKDKKP